MIEDHDIRRRDGIVLFGIALGDAVLDVVTNDAQLEQCIDFLQKPHDAMADIAMGKFGIYPVTLVVTREHVAVIMIDGPDFEESRNQAAGIYVDKNELLQLLLDVVQ
jgi:hypothetical protein